jgi:hypothetical protein
MPKKAIKKSKNVVLKGFESKEEIEKNSKTPSLEELEAKGL